MMNALENAFPEMHNRMPDVVFTEEDLQKDLPYEKREIFDILFNIFILNTL